MARLVQEVDIEDLSGKSVCSAYGFFAGSEEIAFETLCGHTYRIECSLLEQSAVPGVELRASLCRGRVIGASLGMFGDQTEGRAVLNIHWVEHARLHTTKGHAPGELQVWWKIGPSWRFVGKLFATKETPLHSRRWWHPKGWWREATRDGQLGEGM